MAIINGQGRVGVRVTSGSSPVPSSSYLLDTYSGAAAAYSLRKLSSTYSGNCIRVRRSSDNAEQNIGFDGSGNLDTTTLTTFVGAGNGFVVTWYDQSGNGNNATQTNGTYQPKVVSSGTLLTLNGKPTIYGNANYLQQYNSVNAKSSFFVANYTSLNVANYINDKVGLGGTWVDITGAFLTDVTTSIMSNIETTSTKLISCLSLTSGNTSRLFVNNAAQGTSTILNNSNVQSIFGNPANLGPLSNIGNMSEVIYYTTDQYTNFTGINTNINTYYSIYPSDSDAAAFVSAAGITDSTQMSAVNTLVTSLKSSGVWNKMKAIYPVVGGNATAHSKNLINPSQYQLVFSSGWSHSANGMTPSNAYANTQFNPFQQSLSINSAHIAYYRRNVSTGTLIGSLTNTGIATRFTLTPDYGDGYGNISEIISTNAQQQSAIISDVGLIIGNRNSSTSFKLFANNTLKQTVTRTSTAQPNNSFYIGACHENSAATAYNSAQCAFASIGDGLTDSESSTLYTAVQAFQTTLGRQV